MENKIEFEVGDTVRLNSGGPLLTVSKILENEQVTCVWFNDLDDVCTHDFEEEDEDDDEEEE